MCRLVKLQRPPPEMRIFLPGRSARSIHRDTASTATRFYRGHEARCAAAEDEDIETERFHGANFKDERRTAASNQIQGDSLPPSHARAGSQLSFCIARKWLGLETALDGH